MALPNPLEAFTWGAGGARKTPEQIAREREIADAMLAQAGDTSPVGHWTQGAARVANALGGVLKERRANKAEAANASESQGRIAALLGGMGGASQFPGAPGGSASASEPVDYASQRVAQAHAPVDLSGDQQTFIGALLPAAIEESKRTGVDPRIIVAQAAQETGWGKSAPGNNYFGIKSHGKGGGQNLTTHEVVNGQRVKINDSFRQFGSPAESVKGYGDFLLENPRYKPMMEAQGLDAQLQALGASGYATDPNYASSVGAIARGIPMPDQQAAPVQVASLDPSAGMSAVPPEFADMGLSPEAWAGMNAPDGAPALPAPQAVQDMPIAEPQQQVAQAMMGGDTPIDQIPVTAGGTAGALQPGQMPPNAGMNPAIMEALTSPYASDQERAIAGILLKQQMESQDPMRQLEMQKLQRELSAAPERKTAVINGRLVDTQTGQEVASFPEQTKPTSDIQEYEYAKERGYNGSFVDFQLAQKKAGASSTSVTVGEGNKFYEELDKSQAGIFGALSEAGVQGRSKLAQIDRLEGLLSAAETGGMAMIKQAAGEWGIPTEGLSDIQAAQALINELVPQQRQPGSGPMSDADLALFKQSLPRLINQPGGNQAIIDTMRGITQYQIEMGKIADAVADRGMTPAQAREAIRALPNPLAAFGKPKEQTQAPSGVDPSLWNEMTPEERALWN